MRTFPQRISILQFWPFSLRMLAAQLTVCAMFGLLLGLTIVGKVANAAPAQPISTTIDTTEDPKAMGYPDGRKVARDAEGNLYVAYRKKYKQDLRTAYHIFVAKSIDNGHSWSVLNQGRPVETSGDQNQRVPSIAIDSQGTIHIVWYGKDGNNYANEENQIKYVSSADQGRTWSQWRNLAYVQGYVDQPFWQEHPTIYIDDDDILYVAWEGRDAWYQDSAQIKFIRSQDGGKRWSLWKNIAPAPASHSRPTIAGNGRDSLYMLAYGRVATQQQIIYSRSTDGGTTWSHWAPIAPSITEQRHVSAVTDSQGHLHVVWRQASLSLLAQFGLGKQDAKTEINYTTFNGSSWNQPTRLQSGQNGAQTFPSIGLVTSTSTATDIADESTLNPTIGDDIIWIVWSETMESYDYPNDTLASGQIYAITKRGAEWSTPFALASGDHNIYASLARSGGSPAGATMDASDDAYPLGTAITNATIDVVWLDNQQNRKEIRFAQLTTAPPNTLLSATPKTRSLGLLSIQPQQTSVVISGIGVPYWIDWGFTHLLWNRQLGRELQALILIGIAVAGYVLLKFIIARWVSPLLARTVER